MIYLSHRTSEGLSWRPARAGGAAVLHGGIVSLITSCSRQPARLHAAYSTCRLHAEAHTREAYFLDAGP